MDNELRIRTEKRGHLLLIGLDRAAKRNAFDPPMFEQLSAAYAQMEEDPEVRCGVLHAFGDHFTAGLDLMKMAPVLTSGGFPTGSAHIDPLGIYARVRTKPIVASLQGICMTVGIELALACDVRVASKTTRFAQIEVKRGIFPFGGATIRFMRETGWGNAMRWILTGDEFGADEALRIGLVQEVADPPLARAIAIAETIAAQAPLAVMATLRNARRAIGTDDAALGKALFDDLNAVLTSEDAMEGMSSFVERREAKFSGK